MKTVYSRKHKLHATQSLIYDGQPFITEEVPDRADLILAAIQATENGEVLPPMDFGIDPLLEVHSSDYIEYLQQVYQWISEYLKDNEPVLPHAFDLRRSGRKPKNFLGLRGYYGFGAGTPILAGTWEAAYWSAQCAVTAAQLVINGERAAYALCRPPGHHAAADLYGGSCFLNNAAIAARHLLQETSRVAILDIDYHHGNGTQMIFFSDPAVLFCSLHADPDNDFPYFWGASDETGDGDGDGTNLNIPLAPGVGDKEYLIALDQALQRITEFNPGFLVVSAGFDLIKGDPIGGFGISVKGLALISRRIASLGIPTVIVQEGGYLMDMLGLLATTFLSNFKPN